MADKAPAGDKVTARKMDDGKAPVVQGFMNYFPRAIFAVAMVSEYGKRKYNPDSPVFNSGWREVENGQLRYADAEARHRLKSAIEGVYDEGDSGLPHLAQKAWSAMAELERALTDGGVEIRRGNDIVDGKPVLGTAKAIKI